MRCFELRLDLLDDLFDARRMDAAVGDQALEGDAGDLAAVGIEAGEDHRLGRVVDDQVDAGGELEGADVAPLAADDPALHLVARQLDDRDRGLRDVVRSQPLHGEPHQPLRLAVALFPGLVLDAFHQVGGVDARLVLEAAGQLVLGLLRGQAGDLLEAVALLGDQPGGFDLLARRPPSRAR